jgi:hypothetical protein
VDKRAIEQDVEFRMSNFEFQKDLPREERS